METSAALNLDQQYLGAYYDMPEETYHAVKAFSYTGSKALARSPEHYQALLTRPWEADNDRDKFKAVHLLCLEEDKKDKIKVVDGRYAGKLKEEVECLRKAGFIVLKPDAFEEATSIAKKMKQHELAGKILGASACEVSLFWIDSRTGVYCKARLDALTTDDDLIISDLKNFGDLSQEHKIWKQIADQRYHWQMHHYDSGVYHVFGRRSNMRAWIFCEAVAPHGIKVKTAPDAMLERAAIDVCNLMDLYAKCERTNTWPGYATKAEDADLPEYAWAAFK